jgi:hypothetical protein
VFAREHAERRGLRLPDLLEVEFLATAGGTQKYPWGDRLPPADNWHFSRPVNEVNHDRLTTHPSILGLGSGPLEWTSTRTHLGVGSDERSGLRYLVHGGPGATINERVTLGKWTSVNEYWAHRGLAFRCARSPKPRLKAEDFLTRLP